MYKIVENYSGVNYWYKRYDNGWIEQGGYVATTLSASSSAYVLTFPRPFASVPLSITTTVYAPRSSDSSGNALIVKNGTLSATGVTFMNDGAATNKQGFYWEAKGF